MNQSDIHKVAQYIREGEDIVVLTGAGISTESGISDYRSRGGLWERFQPVTFQKFLESDQKRAEYWRRKYELYKSMEKAVPNIGHYAITELFRRGKLLGVVTQNIDGLHQMAGLPVEKVIELHGTNRESICLSCGDIQPWQKAFEELKKGVTVLHCEKCGGLLKPNTISFGQSLDTQVLEKAVSLCRKSDCLLVLGSTLVVEPTASLPRLAKNRGVPLIIVTLSDTPLDTLADVKISMPLGDFVQQFLTVLNWEIPQMPIENPKPLRSDP